PDQDISATKLETVVPANTAWDVVELEKEPHDESVESDLPRAAAENTESFTLDNFDDELEESLVLPDAESVEPRVSSIEDEPESETIISTHDLRDPELVEIFLEEGFEIIESATAALLRWVKQTDNTLELETLQRDLHTLK